MNKVRFGLQNVHVFPIESVADGVETYGTAIPWPGGVSLKISPVGDTSPFYADNRVYYVTSSSSGYEGEFESALIPDDFRIACLGDKEDANGAIYEDGTGTGKAFALAFQFEGDEGATRHILYNCQATRPELEGTTTNDKTEPDLEVLAFTAGANVAGVTRAKLPKDATGYDAFFEAPYKITQTPTP